MNTNQAFFWPAVVWVVLEGWFAFATQVHADGGVPLWTNRFDGPGNGDDIARAIAIDRDGNVFVTGSSFASFAQSDYATIKCSAAGVPLWTNRYRGLGNGVYSAFGIAVDGNGNVFVTGGLTAFSGPTPSDEFATVGYSATGMPLWTNNYNGPYNGTGSGAGRAA